MDNLYLFCCFLSILVIISARSQGDAPDIVRDDVTKVTLFDYSDIIADEKPVYPQKQTAEE